MDLILFVTIAVAVIVVPGPNVLVIVATTLTHGRSRGLQTVAGTSSAMLVQLTVAALGTSWLVGALTRGFLWLKWGGVAYLLLLGFNLLLRTPAEPVPGLPPPSTFQRGFWVSLTNPKTILFFSAFLPQFISPQAAYLPQVALLSLLFWVLAVLLDSGYALLASRIGGWLKERRTGRVVRRFSGLMYLGASALLAGLKRA